MEPAPQVPLESAIDAITLAAKEIPAEDFITYSTILDVHLASALLRYKPSEQAALLRTLAAILSTNTDLTANIGWDLVAVILPFFDQSDAEVDQAAQACLHEVAEHGNPREVILKITESLRQISFVEDDDNQEQHEGDSDEESQGEQLLDTPRTTRTQSTNNITGPAELKFSTLLSVLDRLHSRIKTKFPSRFLSTSLTAILNTYSEAVKALSAEQKERVTVEIIRFVKSISPSNTTKPLLPPRLSYTEARDAATSQNEKDPEAEADSPTSEESKIQTRLLQSFVTHILEDYMISISHGEAGDIPGLAWSSRTEEKWYPDKTVPGRATFSQRFTDNPLLQARDSIVGQVVALSNDLLILDNELLRVIQEQDPTPGDELTGDEAAPPSAPSDIPLSRPGALFLLGARIFSTVLYSRDSTLLQEIPLYPTHASITKAFIGCDGRGGMASIGMESEVIVDTIVGLGLWACHTSIKASQDSGTRHQIRDVDDEDDQFTQYLQALSLLSAHTQSPTLRYHAHILTSSVLHAHSSDLARLAFIKDTLEYCPFENLKASAVSWFKDETIAANSVSSPTQLSDNSDPDEVRKEVSIFSTPVALDTLIPFLFPDLQSALASPPLPDAWNTFKTGFGFYLAGLNLYYFLLAATYLSQPLDIPTLRVKHDIKRVYIRPLEQALVRFEEDIEEIEAAEDGGGEAARADLRILGGALDRVERAFESLEK
ncbi:hypothetical protein FGG08_007131 [Glutinoglossum americanum]|uniref:DUF1760-domain-containing protein n=1 Tax=Glutinoglossum americanum TaxID=1670608 RepID=A0A9P8HUM4_9PEZI|nr:hypothetical protein FGG08_007131 [Glutinoglossum americanum]